MVLLHLSPPPEAFQGHVHALGWQVSSLPCASSEFGHSVCMHVYALCVRVCPCAHARTPQIVSTMHFYIPRPSIGPGAGGSSVISGRMHNDTAALGDDGRLWPSLALFGEERIGLVLRRLGPLLLYFVSRWVPHMTHC